MCSKKYLILKRHGLFSFFFQSLCLCSISLLKHQFFIVFIIEIFLFYYYFQQYLFNINFRPHLFSFSHDSPFFPFELSTICFFKCFESTKKLRINIKLRNKVDKATEKMPNRSKKIAEHA